MAITNTSIQIKKSGTSSAAPSSLNFGELALNYADGKLYFKNSGSVITYFPSASFGTTTNGTSSIIATTPNDTLTVNAGSSIVNSGPNIIVTSNPTTKTLTISHTANVTLTTANITGQLNLSSTLASTSNLTGALVVLGGIGVVGNVFSGGTVTGTHAGSGALLTSIPNTALVNSSVTIGSTAVSLGSTVTSFAGVTLTSPTFTAPVLGTPASGTVTNLTGTASININGTVGATTPTTGVFTTLTSSSLNVNGLIAANVTNAGIELGSTSTVNTPYIDFHSSGNTAQDFDVRLLSSGGNTGGVVGTGTLTIYASTISTTANVALTTANITGQLTTGNNSTFGNTSGNNYLQISAATPAIGAAVSSPRIIAAGSDGNIAITLVPKGTYGVIVGGGSVSQPAISLGSSNRGIYNPSTGTPAPNGDVGFVAGGYEQMRVYGTAAAVNYAFITGNVTGFPVTFGSQGSDTNIGINLTPKGTGIIYANSNNTSTSTSTGALVVLGGIGVVGNVYSGGTFYGSGSGLTGISSSTYANIANTNVITTASTGTFYPMMVNAVTGNLGANAASALNFNAATGALAATTFSGSGASLTSIPNSALSNSSVTIGSTSVSLGSAVTSFAGVTLTSPTLTGNVSTAQLSVGTTNATTAYAYIAPTQSAVQYQFAVTGTNNYTGATVNGALINPNIVGTSSLTQGYGLTINPAFTGVTGTVTGIIGTQSNPNWNSAGSVTNFSGVISNLALGASATGGTITNAYSNRAQAPTIDASATTNITNFYQYYAANITGTANSAIGSAYAFFGSQASTNTGVTNNWNLYMSGNAPNYLAGPLNIASTTLPTTLAVSDGAGIRVNAGQFISASMSTASTASGTAVTIFAIPSNGNAVYLIGATIFAVTDAPNYSTVGILVVSVTSYKYTSLVTAARMSISVSGSNLQATQTSGGNAVIYATATRLA